MTKATIVVDLGYGDAGKGAHVDYLCRYDNATTVVRFNGGSQAGHNVVTEDKIHHCFHTFGSGFLAGAKTFLSRFMMISPMKMFQEGVDLRIKGFPGAFENTWVDPRCLIVTPFHEAANQLREIARGEGRHGSTGQGIGEAYVDSVYDAENYALYIEDLCDPKQVHSALRRIQMHKHLQIMEMGADFSDNATAQQLLLDLKDLGAVDAICDFYCNVFEPLVQVAGPNFLKNILRNEEYVVFEAAQGVLLDEVWGFWPHTTWSKTTRKNADTLLKEAEYSGEVSCHGLVRAYQTRHGRGPFPTEDESLDLYDIYNPTNPWQEDFRVGHLDLVTLDYALNVNGDVDTFIVSSADRLEGKPIYVCIAYEGDSHIPSPIRSWKERPTDASTKFLEKAVPVYSYLDDTEKLCQFLEASFAIPVTIVGYGQTAQDRKIRTREKAQV